jgi:phosphate uptake regulator
MKRKVIRLGTATLVTSLPKTWVNQFGISPGDYLEVAQHNKDLVLSTERKIAVLEKSLDFRKINTRLGNESLIAAYVLGYHTIEVIHEPRIVEYKIKHPLQTTEWLQEQIKDFMVGAEIIEQSETRTLIKEIATTTAEERANTLRRIFLLIKDMGKTLLTALETNDKDALRGMKSRRRNIIKFTIYLQRVFNKEGYGEFAKTNIAFALTEHLLFLPGTIRFIAEDALANKKPYSKNSLKLLAKTNMLIDKLMGMYFDYSPAKAMDILRLREEIWAEMSPKPTPEDAVLQMRLAFIGAHITQCIRSKLMLEL